MTPTDLCEDQEDDLLEPARTAEDMVTDFVDDLVAALINSRIYWTEHPCVKSSIRATVQCLQELCADQSADSITIGVTSEYLIFDDRPLLGASMGAKRLISVLGAWQSGGLQIQAEASVEDFEALLDAVLNERSDGDDFQIVNQHLLARGTPQRLVLLPEFKKHNAHGGGGRGGGAEAERRIAEARLLDVPLHLYQSAMSLLEGITVNISTGGRIDFAPVQEHAETMLKRLQANDGPLVNLACQDQYDAFTFGHSVRVSILALNFGRALTKNSDLLVRLGTAALLHDVGKCMVPFDLLHSRNQLTAEEREEISKHPIYGARILLDHTDSDPYAVAATFGHHCDQGERGYPKTLHEHQISRITEIVGIADIFEALTAARPYKRAMSPIRAYRIMMGMKGRFDQRLLRRFIEVNGVFPTGQLVQLSTGERARIHSQTQSICLPEVRVITDIEGNPLGVEDQHCLDLAQLQASNPGRVMIYRGIPEDRA